jgi:quercetin dioxygenase-like cupin family protein
MAMWRWMRAAPIVYLTITSASIGVAQQQASEQSKSEHGIEALTRFQSKVDLRTKTGALRSHAVTIRNWQLHGTQKIDIFPEKGSLIIQLHSGKVKTLINGKETQHKMGEFWFVPAGARMSLQVVSESALVQVFSLQR